VRGPHPGAKDTGLRNLPLKGFAQNQLCCEIVALACDLLAWTQALALTGAARRRGAQAAPPAPVRHRRTARPGQPPPAAAARRRWPWAGEITAAITRLQALSSG